MPVFTLHDNLCLLRRAAWKDGRIFVHVLAEHEAVPTGAPVATANAPSATSADTAVRRSRRQRQQRTIEMHVLRAQTLHFLKLQVRQ